MFVHCIILLVIGSSIFTLTKTQKMPGEGVNFHNYGHRLAPGHVNDMRCLGKVDAPANYIRTEFEISEIYQDVNHSFRM